MSVEKMKAVTIDGNFDKLDDVLSVCLDCGCFQPENISEYLSMGISGITKISEENPYKQALDRIENHMEESKIKPKFIDAEDGNFCYENCELEIADFEKHFSEAQIEKKKLQDEIALCKTSIQQLMHFSGIQVNLHDIFDCAFISAHFGRLPAESYQMLDSYRDNPHVWFIPFSNDRNYYWGMYLVPKKAADEVVLIFAGLFFERLRIIDTATTPTAAIEEMTARQTAAEQRLGEIDLALKNYWQGQESHMLSLYTQLTRLSLLFELRKYAVRHAGHFMLTGWVPASGRKAFEEKLLSIEGLRLTFADTKSVKRASPPTKIKNPRLFNAYEFYIKMFGVPKYGEIDPTIFVALTYTLIYGIMFADLGQGLVLSVVGWLMYKLKKMQLGRLLIPCGISGAFFGLVFGSVFGFEEMLNPLYRAVGLREKPIDVMDSKNIMTILIAAVGIGVLLLFLSIMLSIYSMLKQRNLGGAIFSSNGITGLVLYGGIILAVLNTALGLKLPGGLVISLILIPCVLLLFKEPLEKLINGEEDWKPESWGEYITQGFFEVFESLLSYLTNTVSFLRIGAFVLVHASMMMVFFSLAEMVGGIFSIILIVFGNVFVLALEGLLVGVQCLRLEFYEMFNRFYQGSGTEFKPISLTKQ